MKSLLRRKKLIWTIIILGLFGYYLRYMYLQVKGTRYLVTEQAMASSVRNASYIILNYWEENGVTRLPNDVVSSTGEPILSWRVRLLSVVPKSWEERRIKIDETQSWDSPANEAALELRPYFYFYPIFADFYPFPFTLFQKRQWVEQREPKTCLLRITEVQDALEAGIALHDDDPYVVLVAPQHAVPWTKPQDVSIWEILNGDVELYRLGATTSYIDVKGDYYKCESEQLLRIIRRLACSNSFAKREAAPLKNYEPSREATEDSDNTEENSDTL